MTTGRELAEIVADFIEQHPEKYSQSRWGWEGTIAMDQLHGDGQASLLLNRNACGTSACAAGNAIREADRLGIPINTQNTIPEEATRLLELSSGDADWLFDGRRYEDMMPIILRTYAQTGVIDRTLDESEDEYEDEYESDDDYDDEDDID